MKKVLGYLACFVVLFLSSSVNATTALMTTKITFADTILAKVISDIYGYPVILVDRDHVSNETLEELKDLNVTDIIIIGGPYVVTPKVEDELKNLGYNVTRIWGVTRYETSALVAKFFWDSSDEAVLLTRELVNERVGVQDLRIVREALDFAVDKKIPVLITPTGHLEENVVDALLTLGVNHVYIFTVSGNLGNLTRELESLGITYEVKSEIDLKRLNCTKIIKIAVPKNAGWEFGRDLLIGFKCVQIVPVPPNATLEELKGFDYVVLSKDGLRRLRSKIREEAKEKLKKVKEKVRELLRKRMEKILSIIEKNIEKLEESYNKTGDVRILEVLNKAKQKREEIITLIRNKEYEKALREGMKAIAEINEFKWRHELYVIEQKIKKIENVLRRFREREIRVLARIFNLTKEDIKKIKEKIKKRRINLWKIKEKVMEKLREKLQTRICKPVCKNIGTRSEGWYDPCTGELIKYDDCAGCRVICTEGPEGEGWYAICAVRKLIGRRMIWAEERKFIKAADCKRKQEEEERMCIQVLTYACSPEGECKWFPTPCDIPEGWKITRPGRTTIEAKIVGVEGTTR